MNYHFDLMLIYREMWSIRYKSKKFWFN